MRHYRLHMLRGLPLSLLIIFLATVLVAEGQTTVTPIPVENKIDIDFPDTITFSLDLETEEEVEQVFLRYGTNALTCQSGGTRRSIPFETGDRLTAEWEWDQLQTGGLPPGAEIWWEWEVELTDQESISTERQSETVTDTGPNWQSLSSERLTLYWYLGDDQFGQEMFEFAIEELDRIEANVGVQLTDPVFIWVYPSTDALLDVLLYASEWAGGVAFTAFRSILIAVAPGDDLGAQAFISHELTHLVVEQRVFNCRGTGLPIWLNEGLAVAAEPNVEDEDLSGVYEALDAGTLPPLRTLTQRFSAYGRDAGLAYDQSYLAVKYLLDTYGSDAMGELLSAVQAGEILEDALLAVFGLTVDELDAAWRLGAGYESTPVPTAEPIEVGDATPVPTVGLSGIPVAPGGEETPTPEPSSEPSSTPTAEPSPTEILPTETATAAAPTPTAAATEIAANIEAEENANQSEVEPPPSSSGATNRLILWISIAVIGGLLVVLIARRIIQ